MEYKGLAKKELEAREKIKEEIFELIMKACDTGAARIGEHVRVGNLQRYVYNTMGYIGRPGDHFADFITKILEERGFRKGWSQSARVYYGLKWKDPEFGKQFKYHDCPIKYPTWLHGPEGYHTLKKKFKELQEKEKEKEIEPQAEEKEHVEVI